MEHSDIAWATDMAATLAQLGAKSDPAVDAIVDAIVQKLDVNQLHLVLMSFISYVSCDAEDVAELRSFASRLRFHAERTD
jgi:hypothetical protein